jgi:hypothetical protein
MGITDQTDTRYIKYTLSSRQAWRSWMT